MTRNDAETILAIAALAATADGDQSEAERASVVDAAARLGVREMLQSADGPAGTDLDVATLATKLSDAEARRIAYETAAAVCHADGPPNGTESAFLDRLQEALGTPGDAPSVAAVVGTVSAPLPIGARATTDDPGTLILDQAMLTAACELLPDRLATLSILPLQLRLVYTIGQRNGQPLDMSQAKDLAAALGIGAAAQVMERVVRQTLGGVAGGLLGGLLGGAAGIAVGAAITFASTYALGHVAEQY
ncbi:MAG: GTPase, partial [Gemmatimonadaceae bacterium]